MEGKESGTFVGSGSFRVDRRKALQILKDYQLPDPNLFAALWVRAAVAGGATSVEIAMREPGLTRVAVEFRFGGRPFGEPDLNDPFSSLFDREDPNRSRARDLALGLLAVLRLAPRSVEIVSGWGSARRRLKIDSLEKWALAQEPPGETDTLLEARWGPEAELTGLGGVLERGELFAMSPVPIRIFGKEIPRFKAGEAPLGVAFSEGGVRGWLTVPARDFDRSDLTLYRSGVLAGNITRHFPEVNVWGRLNDDALPLTASLGVAEGGPELERLSAAAQGQAGKLLDRMLREQAQRLPETVRSMVLAPWLASYWEEALSGRAAFDPATFEPLESGWHGVIDPMLGGDRARTISAIRRVLWDARVTAWLRNACFRLLNSREWDVNQPRLEALWEVPLFPSASGGTLSMRQIEDQRSRMGWVAYSRKPWTFGPEIDVIWCVSPAEVDSLTLIPSWVGVVREWGGPEHG